MQKSHPDSAPRGLVACSLVYLDAISQQTVSNPIVLQPRRYDHIADKMKSLQLLQWFSGDGS
jgi:hypothetical protein